MKRNWIGYLFISPWLIGFACFTAFPFVASILLSFCRYDVVSPPTWVGLANYEVLFSEDPRFWHALGNTLFYAAVAVPLGLAAALGLALLLSLELRGISVYRTIFFLPSIVPAVATSVVFVWILNPQIGLVNGLLEVFGVRGPAWLQDERWAMWSLILMSVWGAGGTVIVYLAGLKDIPSSLYEAALVDGAGTWARTRHITLPMLTPITFFNLIMGVIHASQYFTQAYIMTQGGPADSTLFYALYLFLRAWRYLDMGYASAMAWVLFLIVAGVTWALFKTHRRWVHYE
ncbi:MAG: sugar ABC transporter permease [Candidatus Latescibacteria bacterium]|nr:sugar ABC transporter permease [Candidatus Latescibacterota bacterium]